MISKSILLVAGAAVLVIATIVFVSISGFQRRVTPVLFVHGWANDSGVWEAREYTQLFDDKEFVIVGKMREESGNIVLSAEIEESVSARYPIYLVDFPDRATGDIIRNGELLSRMIQSAKENHGARKVILVGFSLGGVICREYTTSVNYDKDVKRLITISSPHRGTEFAILSEWVSLLDQRRQNSTEDGILATAGRLQLDAAMGGIESVGGLFDLDIRSEALRMLKPPEQGNYMNDLNHRSHPKDVEWFSIVAEKNIATYQPREFWLDITEKLGEDPKTSSLFSVASDLVRNLPNLVDGRYSGGDGVVSTESQSLLGIPGLEGCDVKSYREDASHMQDFVQKELVKLLIGEVEDWQWDEEHEMPTVSR